MAKKPKRGGIPEATRARTPGPHLGGGRRRRTLVLLSSLAGVVLAAVAAFAIYLALPDHTGPTPPKAVSTVDANRRVCVLSDPGDTRLADVDSGLQQAAQMNGHLNVQHFTAPPAQTDVTPTLNSLITLRCAVIVGLGPRVSDAVAAYTDGSQKSTVRFIVVGSTPANSPQVSAIDPTALTPSAIATLVEGDVR